MGQGGNKLPLPPFTESGDFPLGVYRAAFHEIEERFGSGTPLRIRSVTPEESFDVLGPRCSALLNYTVRPLS